MHVLDRRSWQPDKAVNFERGPQADKAEPLLEAVDPVGRHFVSHMAGIAMEARQTNY